MKQWFGRRRRAFNHPGHAHELTFACFRSHALLSKDRACQWLAHAIDAARQQLEFDLWAYVFMPNHVHLVVRPRRSQYQVATLLKAIKEPVSREAIAFLKRESPDWLPNIAVERGRRMEHRFWQAGGGYDRNITDSKTLVSMVEYIHLNPVRKRLVVRAADWTWSSAGWFEGAPRNILRPDPIAVEWLTDAQ